MVVIAVQRFAIVSPSHDEAFATSLLPVFSVEFSVVWTVRYIRFCGDGLCGIRRSIVSSRQHRRVPSACTSLVCVCPKMIELDRGRDLVALILPISYRLL